MTSASLASSSSRPGPTGQCIPETIECLTFSKTVLLTAALTKDIGGLIQAYKEKNSFDYPPFATLWKSRQFSLIHFTCNDPQSRDTFIDGLTEVLFRKHPSLECVPAFRSFVNNLRQDVKRSKSAKAQSTDSYKMMHRIGFLRFTQPLRWMHRVSYELQHLLSVEKRSHADYLS
ncbi:hypothetical protein K457DRAFT_178567 [Linnemannia elongata AG-77]|uniref:Uncharacterized protein n=1 Tax=Linnemannia elongata AG-77 TaxID=1314771 RepID=A0A197KGR3_9FUNG|nr:hypothetical protein K457DRAFT_178567 [Linnemannia elongata AG-77]